VYTVLANPKEEGKEVGRRVLQSTASLYLFSLHLITLKLVTPNQW
jgi:hypothetical protein